MTQKNRWLLPEGVDELLPPQAWDLERLRRNLLDLYHSWGYELVMPPFVEFLESLLIGTGSDLELQTFKLIDQLSGRTLGIRADMTPQVARIDAHRLKQQGPNRLCYMGTVLHTRGDDFGGSRAPVQIGAELYGHRGNASDLEILRLMLETCKTAAIEPVYLDLGHVAIFRGLVQAFRLDRQQEAQLFDILQRKALPELTNWLGGIGLPERANTTLRTLVFLHGGPDIITQARRELKHLPESVQDALSDLEYISTTLQKDQPELPIHIDLAELRGYHYHTGLVFATYVPGQGQEIARGGRYDQIGAAFGRARPATGFSADLKTLLALSRRKPRSDNGGIYAPDSSELDPRQALALEQAISALRCQGQRVIRALPDTSIDPGSLGCDRLLRWLDKRWQITSLSEQHPELGV